MKSALEKKKAFVYKAREQRRARAKHKASARYFYKLESLSNGQKLVAFCFLLRFHKLACVCVCI